jgi:hypothetical protein
MGGLATREVIDNGQAFTLVDGVMVPQHIANDRKVDGAPAVVLHRLNETDIGQMIQTDNVQKGILLDPYFRFYDPKRGGVVGPVFDYFAAPRDARFGGGSKKIATYDSDIQRIAKLADVCGHNGILLLNDAAIYDVAEADPAKLALWHMPTLSLVSGQNISYRDRVNPNNMYNHKNKGVLQGTFTDENSSRAHWYWSAYIPYYEPSVVRAVTFTNCVGRFISKNTPVASSRPVRAEIRPW